VPVPARYRRPAASRPAGSSPGESENGNLAKIEAYREQAQLFADVAEFDSRAHRDEVMESVVADFRVIELMKNSSPADMRPIRYAGFETFIGTRQISEPVLCEAIRGVREPDSSGRQPVLWPVL